MDIFRASFLSVVLVALVACGGTSSSSSASSTSSSSSASGSSSSGGVSSSSSSTSSSSSSSGDVLPLGCSATHCVLFDESVEEGYGTLASFELLENNTSFFYYGESPESSHLKWTVVDTKEPGFNNVIEVTFNNNDPDDLVNDNGWFGVVAAEDGSDLDLSEFARGALAFDMRIVQNGAIPNLLEFHMECYWPCHSTESPVLDPSELNKWQTYVFPMERLIATGLDITHVNHLFVFKPTWNLQVGQYVIQLDNIRLSKHIPEEEVQECANHSSAMLFDDCFSSHWVVGVEDDAEQETYFNGDDALPKTHFGLVDIGDGSNNKVIDIHYFQATGFSAFNFYPLAEGAVPPEGLTTTDLTVFQEGYIAFDLRILDYGLSELGLFLTIQCDWPCRSRYFPVANRVGAATDPSGFPLKIVDQQWYQVKIPMAELTADNLDDTHPELDLSAVDKVVFAPGWASSTELMGFHFQIDNVRFEP